jgi:hypothetical protein
MIRIGRYTAALAMTGIGILLLLDHGGAVDAMAILRVWWPVALVAFGVELLIVQGVLRKEGTRVRLAFGAMFGAAVLSGFMLVATQGSELRLSSLQQWTDGVSWGLYDSEHAKHSFDKGIQVVPLLSPDDTVAITDMNGQVILKKGPVKDIEVHTSVYVDMSDPMNAATIARQSYVEIKGGKRTEIVAHGEPYGMGKMRKPRLNLTITIPEGRLPSSVEVGVGNGSIRVEQLPESKDLVLDVKNGDISGEGIGGSLRAKVLNGDVKLSRLDGSATVETVNGDIELLEVRKAISAKTVNGDIQLRSPVVGGAWSLSSTLGDITIAWPEDAGVKVKAATGFGDVHSDWPLDGGQREVSGTLGDGTWTITANTKADVSLKRFEP